MDPQIRRRCTHVVIHKHCTGHDGYGVPSYAPDVDLMAYVAKKITQVRDREGKVVISDTALYLDGVLTVSLDDAFILDGEERPVLSCSAFDGLPGNTGTTVVYF